MVATFNTKVASNNSKHVDNQITLQFLNATRVNVSLHTLSKAVYFDLLRHNAYKITKLIRNDGCGLVIGVVRT